MSEWQDPLSPESRPYPSEPATGMPLDLDRFPEPPGMSSSWASAEVEQQHDRRLHHRQIVVAVAVMAAAVVYVAIGTLGGGSSSRTDQGVSSRSLEPPPSTLTAPLVVQTTGVPTTLVTPSSEAIPALQLLEVIVVANENEGGYDRDLFGYPGIEDGSGCDTRDRVLIDESRSLAQVDYPGCQVIAGDWLSLYDLAEFTDPAELEVDHVVALKEAWDSGAWEWSPETLVAFGNDTTDPRTLRAVSTSTNRSKGEKDPSNWMPPEQAVWCQYLADWVAIKARWGLTMDPSEFGRINRLLREECPDTLVEPFEPAPIVLAYLADPDPDPDPDPDAPLVVAPVSRGSDSGGSVYYSNCAEARAAGVTPIYVGEAGYRAALDRDGDGVACE